MNSCRIVAIPGFHRMFLSLAEGAIHHFDSFIAQQNADLSSFMHEVALQGNPHCPKRRPLGSCSIMNSWALLYVRRRLQSCSSPTLSRAMCRRKDSVLGRCSCTARRHMLAVDLRPARGVLRLVGCFGAAAWRADEFKAPRSLTRRLAGMSWHAAILACSASSEVPPAGDRQH